jgi:hypothetical protein
VTRVAALALAILGAAWAAQAAPRQSEARLFEKHDCCGRLAHSKITKVGDIRSGGRTFTIYSLWFVNPQSRHGMRRLAIVEGSRFRGSYIISSWATPMLKDGVVRFKCGRVSACGGHNFAIREGRLPAKLWVDGEVNELEQTI